MFKNRKTEGLGGIDEGTIKSGKIQLEGRNDFINLGSQNDLVNLTAYQLKEEGNLTLSEINNSLFDSLRNKHNDFLTEYLKRDFRY